MACILCSRTLAEISEQPCAQSVTQGNLPCLVSSLRALKLSSPTPCFANIYLEMKERWYRKSVRVDVLVRQCRA